MAYEVYPSLYTGSQLDSLLASASKLCPSSSELGKTNQPIYLHDGILTPCSATLGSASQGIYMNNGELVASNATIGTATRPTYMANGVVTQCDPFTLIFQNITVGVAAWTADSTYSDYPYVAIASCSGCTANHFPEVVFNIADATSGYFAPICESISGGVKIWATQIPSDAITIPTIKCTKAN